MVGVKVGNKILRSLALEPEAPSRPLLKPEPEALSPESPEELK